MYKAGHSAVPKTAFPSIQKQRPSFASHQSFQKGPEKRKSIPSKKTCDELLLHSEISVPIFNNKPKLKHNTSPLILTPPSTPLSPYIEQQIEFLHNSWRAFRETPTGEVDPTIVTFRRGKELPPDFEPFNIDRFLAEKLLKELDIDPKFAIF
ncbi:hypothetical protein KIN20_000298 [Parelaphostrongylus tenuis]|uniref:Uncharacterized protein n=1 Tax=Parelaphostrongylus tenuis TaxID=148309 RepID=A0AAD5QBE5_PARTN|nr:hypothetical protein KIN20_000298 [Parelaphostrongylus tenuis]